MTDLHIPYRGDAKREPVLSYGPIFPWRARVTVEAVYLSRGRQTATPREVTFEVAVEWTGPPAPGFPPSSRAVQARDVHAVQDLEAARGLALMAKDAWAKGGDQAPDLRELARQLAARST